MNATHDLELFAIKIIIVTVDEIPDCDHCTVVMKENYLVFRKYTSTLEYRVVKRHVCYYSQRVQEEEGKETETHRQKYNIISEKIDGEEERSINVLKLEESWRGVYKISLYYLLLQIFFKLEISQNLKHTHINYTHLLF